MTVECNQINYALFSRNIYIIITTIKLVSVFVYKQDPLRDYNKMYIISVYIIYTIIHYNKEVWNFLQHRNFTDDSLLSHLLLSNIKSRVWPWNY